MSNAQTAETGALSGTVTDPSNAVISGATITITSLASGQIRTATTDAGGSYKVSLLQPGNYSVKISAAGFKTVQVPSVTIDVAETATLSQKLEVGIATQQITVSETTETIQTEGVANGTVVSGEEIQTLPLVTRNYTQILDLSPGVVTNVANATAMGNGTQDVSANGQGGISNSYSMDGANITQYTSGGAAQLGSMPGIPIPSPDAIQEFKVQTSQYDAGFGRNAGANVEVITKGGTNNFHGSLLEYNRNNMFNANDFFYKLSEEVNKQPNKPQTLKQNTFGGTIGGPIKKDKLFFFFSYQGYRQLNGIAVNGFASGFESAATLMPWNDYNFATDGLGCTDIRCTNDPAAYKKYLGSVFGPTGPCPFFIASFGAPPNNCNTGFADGVTVADNGSNISNTAVALLQSKGAFKTGYNQGGFWIAGAPSTCTPTSPNLEVAGVLASGCRTAISLPTIANENQYMGNSDWNINSKNVLSERYIYQIDPEIQSFDCLFTGSCNPGSPADVSYISHTGTLRLTSTLSSTLINEARFTFQRNLEDATDPNPLLACNLANGGSIIPLNNNGEPCSDNVKLPIADFGIVPSMDVLNLYSSSGDWNQGGNFAGTGENIDNEFQAGDLVSWNRGRHTLRFGFDWEFDQYNNKTPASGRGEVLFDNTADFLTSSSGLAIDGTPQTGLPPGAPPPSPVTACGFFSGSPCAGGAVPIALRGLLTHYDRISAYDWFAQDDIKVNAKLTVNVGLRWEYDGWPADKLGQFDDVWANQAATVNTGSFFLSQPLSCVVSPTAAAEPVGTLAGFVIPTNFDPAAGLTGPCGVSGVKKNGNKTLFPGSPLDNFMPRLGVAWQPFGHKFVVRAGYGWYYDRAGSIYLVDNLLQEPPYSGPITGTSITNLENTLHSPFQAVASIPLTWTPRYFSACASSATVSCLGQFNLNGYNAFPGPCTPNCTLDYSGLGLGTNSPEMSQRLPLTQQYNLDLQYDLGHGWVIDVGYLGSHSIHVLNQGTPINVAHLVGTPASLLCGGVTGDCGAQDLVMFKNPNFPGGNPIPFNDPANATPVTVNSTQNAPARVSYLGFTPGALGTTNTIGDAKYNSLQAQLRHNFAHGMLLQVSYTWSKSLTDVNSAEPGLLDVGQNDFGTTSSNDPLNLAQQYGPNSGNRPQRLIASYTYDLPWKSTEGLSGKLLGGWAISGITTVQSGQALTVTDAGGGTIYGGTSRALLADPVNCRAGGKAGVCDSGIAVATSGSTEARVLSDYPGAPGYNPTGFGGWINSSAFTAFSTLTASSPLCVGGVLNPTGSPADNCGAAPSFFAPPGSPAALGATYLGAGTGWGNSPVGIITGPGQWNWDVSIQKNTKIREWGTLQFRTDFFDIWNHPQFSNPVSTAYTGTPFSTFGQIQSTSVEPRMIQFALHFQF